MRTLNHLLASAIGTAHVIGTAHAMPPASIPRADVVSDPREPDESAPSASTPAYPDRLFPGAGRVAVTASSGIPHALLADIAVGVSPWFSLDAGATVSAKFNETSIFVRPRFALATSRWVDVAFHMPIAYYPKSDRRDGWDWLLTNPALFVRGRFASGTSVYGGVGAVFASMTESLATAFRDPEPAAPPEDWDFSDVGEEGPTTVNGAWNTFHLGVDQALSDDWILSVDGILLMNGLRVSESYAEKVGPPVFVQGGVTFVF